MGVKFVSNPIHRKVLTYRVTPTITHTWILCSWLSEHQYVLKSNTENTHNQHLPDALSIQMIPPRICRLSLPRFLNLPGFPKILNLPLYTKLFLKIFSCVFSFWTMCRFCFWHRDKFSSPPQCNSPQLRSFFWEWRKQRHMAVVWDVCAVCFRETWVLASNIYHIKT